MDTQSQASDSPVVPIDEGTPGLPTLNPSDSPYKPLELPTVTPTVLTPPPEEKPPKNLGAVSHAGAAAYLIDNVLKGASHGYAMGQQYAADQHNKRLKASQSLYNDQAAQLYDIAKSGRAGTFSGPPGPDGKPTFVPSKEFDETRKRTLVAWDAMMQATEQGMPQLKKGKKGKSSTPGAGGDDPNALLQQALNHKDDPQAALAATYLLARKLGPPVNHQIVGFLTPDYIARQQAASQGENARLTAATEGAEATAAKDKNEVRLQELRAQGRPADPAKAKAWDDEVANLTAALTPPRRTFTAAETTRYAHNPDGTWSQYQIDPNTGEEVPGTLKPLGGQGAPPKVGTAGALITALYGPHPTAKQQEDGMREWNRVTKAMTTIGTHTVMVWNGQQEVPVQVETTSTREPAGASSTHVPTSAHPSRVSQGNALRTARNNAGVISTGTPVGFKFSPGTSDLLKKAADANGAYRGMRGFYDEALRNAADIKKDPANGTAKMNLVSIFLKSIGAHSSALSGSQVRMTQSEWNMAMQSAPAWSRFLSKFATTQNGTTYLSGVTLTPSQVTDLVRAIGEKALSMKGTWQDLQKQAKDAVVADKSGVGTGETHPSIAPTHSSLDNEILNLVHP